MTEKLYELLSQNQFELLPPFDTGRLRLVYLMNDAVESFLVFEEAVLTGFYDENYEGELEAELRREEDGRYVLVVYQGKTVCTIFFRHLSLDMHLFNYGKIGHVWMKKHEDLRQIEYWTAIMRAKWDYLGECSCNEAEKELALIEAFPPLNVCSYPAVPRQYYEPRADADIPDPDAIAVMQKLAEEAGDQKLVRVLESYKKHHGKRATKYIAGLLQKNAHTRVTDLLMEKIIAASSMYPDRFFSPEEEKRYADVRKQAEHRKKRLRSEKTQVHLLCQTPFQEARDDVEFQVHLLIIRRGLLNRRVRVETYK